MVRGLQRLMIVRGLPGSGQSTYARRQRSLVHVESDQFWCVGGEYRFEAARLGEAHEWCLTEVERHLIDGRSVVVSNTFTTIRELLPYIQLAEESHITPEIVHGVPEAVVKKMAARWEPWGGERVYRPRRATT